MSSMDSDEVNSIDDTVESQQVVALIKTVYDDIVSRGGMQIHKTLFNLDASIDPLQPVLMTKPSTIDTIEWVKYNRIKTTDTFPTWAEMIFRPLDEFLFMSHQMNPTETNVDTMTIVNADGYTITFNFRNDLGPTYYTSYDDTTLIFDAYDSVVDTTLNTAKTLCYGSKNVVFTEEDTWVPDLQADQFALLLNESKSLAWAELKQTAHQKAEQTARRNWRHLSKTKEHIPGLARADKLTRMNAIDLLPNYGRR